MQTDGIYIYIFSAAHLGMWLQCLSFSLYILGQVWLQYCLWWENLNKVNIQTLRFISHTPAPLNLITFINHDWRTDVRTDFISLQLIIRLRQCSGQTWIPKSLCLRIIVYAVFFFTLGAELHVVETKLWHKVRRRDQRLFAFTDHLRHVHPSRRLWLPFRFDVRIRKYQLLLILTHCLFRHALFMVYYHY